MTISEMKMRDTPIFPFFISSHSSISVDNISKTFNAIPIPKANPTAAVIDQPTARRYWVKSPIVEFGSNILTPYIISIFFIIICINSDESKLPFAKEIATSESQLATKVLNCPFEAGTATLTRTDDGV